MKQQVLTRSLMLSVAATLVSGALYYFSTGLAGFRPLVWIAPLPILVMATRSSRKSAATSAFGAYLLGGFAIAGWQSYEEWRMDLRWSVQPLTDIFPSATSTGV